MSTYKTCQKVLWRGQGEHFNIMIPNIQKRHVISLSAKFYCVLKGLEIKAKERNSLTSSVTSTESMWIEISSLKRTNKAESVLYYLTEMGSLAVICWEKSEIPRAEKTTVLPLPPWWLLRCHTGMWIGDEIFCVFSKPHGQRTTPEMPQQLAPPKRSKRNNLR